MEQFKEDMKELKVDVKELVKQGIVHNELLRQHEAYSLALQNEQKAQALRLVPIENHVTFVNRLGKSSLTILLGVILYAITHWLRSLWH